MSAGGVQKPKGCDTHLRMMWTSGPCRTRTSANCSVHWMRQGSEWLSISDAVRSVSESSTVTSP
jgi:hypothetical protein